MVVLGGVLPSVQARADLLVAPWCDPSSLFVHFTEGGRPRGHLRSGRGPQVFNRVSRTSSMRILIRELTLSLRSLGRAWVFLLFGTGSLAVGNSTVAVAVAVAESLFAQPPGVSQPEALVDITPDRPSSFGAGLTADQRSALNASLESIELSASWVPIRGALLHGGEVSVVSAEAVSGSFFSLLRVVPALGRPIGSTDDTPGAPPVAVIG